jgi:hypothetical protein
LIWSRSEREARERAENIKDVVAILEVDGRYILIGEPFLRELIEEHESL